MLKLNLAQAVMLGAIYEACDPKPDIDTLTRFYHEFLTRPAMCAIDYDMGDISNHLFLRDHTLATGGAVCDCHYVRKSAATQEEWDKSQDDGRREALRGGRTLE